MSFDPGIDQDDVKYCNDGGIVKGFIIFLPNDEKKNYIKALSTK